MRDQKVKTDQSKENKNPEAFQTPFAGQNPQQAEVRHSTDFTFGLRAAELFSSPLHQLKFGQNRVLNQLLLTNNFSPQKAAFFDRSPFRAGSIKPSDHDSNKGLSASFKQFSISSGGAHPIYAPKPVRPGSDAS